MTQVEGLSVPRGLEDLCDPTRTALLVYDMQVGIRAQVKTGDQIVAQCAELLAAARRCKMRVAYSQHLSNSLEWMGVSQVRTAMAWQKIDDPRAVKSWFLRDAPGSEIVPELAPRPEDLVVQKLSMSAFEGTPLAFALRDCGIQALAICGIALEIGIEPTVRHATDLGVIPIVIADACGSGSSEAGERALETMRFVGEAIITDLQSFCGTLDTPSAARNP
jgi:nicotinamidase-related amidase